MLALQRCHQSMFKTRFLLLILVIATRTWTASSFFLAREIPATSSCPTSGGSRWRPVVRTRVILGATKDDNLSAAAKERREEERRRQVRKTDVVIGKTSAITGAKDFPIDFKSTEEAWMKQASNLEQKVYRQTEIGMEMLKLLQLEEAVSAFDTVFELKPNAYCWQAGIVKFYLGDLIEASKIFRDSALIYESRFKSPASEERIWRDACELKFISSLEKKEKDAINEKGGVQNVIAQLQAFQPTPDSTPETRRVFRITRELFAASVADDSVGLVLSRAKLRSICGASEPNPRADRKMWKLNSWFYLGLHYDALGQDEESKTCMKMALLTCPNSKGDDIIHTLPLLHMSCRDWFDDDEMNEVYEVPCLPDGAAYEVPAGVIADPIVVESIYSSISRLKHHELKDALKARGLMSSGAKEVLRQRLFKSLISDAGLFL